MPATSRLAKPGEQIQLPFWQLGDLWGQDAPFDAVHQFLCLGIVPVVSTPDLERDRKFARGGRIGQAVQQVAQAAGGVPGGSGGAEQFAAGNLPLPEQVDQLKAALVTRGEDRDRPIPVVGQPQRGLHPGWAGDRQGR